MTIQLTYQNDRIYVKMPFDYKDDFKMLFASAKWHPTEKAWSVNESDEMPLLAWIEDAPARAVRSRNERLTPLLAWIDNAPARAAKPDDEGLQEQAAQMMILAKTRDINRDEEKKAKERTAASLLTIKTMKDEIASIEAEIAFDRKEREANEAEIIEKLGSIIDFTALHEAAATMARLEAPTATNDEKQWQGAQDVLIAARNVLRNANLSIEAVDFLASLRHGRASVRAMTTGAWYSVKQY